MSHKKQPLPVERIITHYLGLLYCFFILEKYIIIVAIGTLGHELLLFIFWWCPKDPYV